MRKKINIEIKVLLVLITILFGCFLAMPILLLLQKSFQGKAGISLIHYGEVITSKGFLEALKNSFFISAMSSVIATILAFIMAYSINYTNLHCIYKKTIKNLAILPMLLPTITYGFAMIYSFGKQGLITKLLGRQLFDIYGWNGLFIGYILYTLPVAFMLINNTMGYIDKKFMVVSKIMGDAPIATFINTILWPLVGTLVASFIQCFFLCFTDFGIPASVGGEIQVVASVLYTEMLGSLPDFNNGAVIAMIMLLPSIISAAILRYLEKYNVRYHKISTIEIEKNSIKDGICGVITGGIIVSILSIFLVIFIVPFVKGWPYNMQFTLEHVRQVFQDGALSQVYRNSLIASTATAIIGTMVAYGAAIITTRSQISHFIQNILNGISLVPNTIPGMVLGIAFLLTFSGTSLQNTLPLMVLCNIVHYFTTPYLMMTGSLSKMNLSWERTAKLMGDSWLKTLIRIITPNAMISLIEVFTYYFINSMVTVSAIIFLAGARTMVITTKIKELQHFAKFNEIFVLSLLILFTNLLAKGFLWFISQKKFIKENKKRKRKDVGVHMKLKKIGILLLIGVLMIGCSSRKEAETVVLYTNADDEAVEAMKNALDNNGYRDQYILQSFGTSELGGKLLAEGTNIEADLITMSSFYLESAQEKNNMFTDLTFDTGAVGKYTSYYTPITAQEGSIIYNTKVMKENQLKVPTAIKDLANAEYKDMISVTDIENSTTAWLLIQAIISEYGEDGAKEGLKGIYQNAGAHIEESGSGPIKKVRAGEVAIGFGLRHQAVEDKASGLPIDYVDPIEGNFTLTESIAVTRKGGEKEELAMKMAECIIKNGRKELLKTYPITLYQGEKTDIKNQSKNSKVFGEKLTTELLKKHQAFSKECK